MENRSLGSSGLRVSSLCLGAMTFGEAEGWRQFTEETTRFWVGEKSPLLDIAAYAFVAISANRSSS
jgi:hypothetical protein